MNTLKIAAALTLLTLTAATAHAADLHPQQPMGIAAADVATNWDGPYVGAQLGYGWGTASAPGHTATLSGLLVGGQAGYNFHLSDGVVAGIEGDLAWNNEQGTFSSSTTTERINWDASVRGRLGLDLGQVMPYAEAGVAFANATGGAYTANHTGWTVGAGAEFMLATNLSANVEYRYSDYGTQTYGGTTAVSLTDSTVRVGLNYHF